MTTLLTPNPNFHMPTRGFSLAETAIGLAVIAVLLGIFLSSKQLIGAAELRNFSSAVKTYQAAIDSFRDNYGMLPGDFSSAETYWSTYDASTAPDGTVNGDGDGDIEYPSSGEAESLRAWQQLALSKQIDGSYSGLATGTNNQADIGINVPSTSRSGVGYYLISGDLVGAGTRNEIRLGAFRAGAPNSNAALTPSEAKNLDVKMDDGNPTGGNVYAGKGSDIVSETCRSSATVYNTSLTTRACVLSFPATP